MEDLRSIVATMKTLSAVMLNQLESRLNQLNAFDRTTRLGLSAVLKNSPLLAPASPPIEGAVAWIVIGAERGFCGRFNERIAEYLLAERCADQDLPLLFFVGTRLSEKLLEYGLNCEGTAPLPATPEGLEQLQETLLGKINQWRNQGISQINTIHTQRVEVSRFEIVDQIVWPISAEDLLDAQQADWPTRQHPMVFDEPVEAIQFILRQMLKTRLLLACVDSMACESGARLANLQTAEENIDQRLDELNHLHNSQRQSAITAELQDITAAFDLVLARD